MQLQTLSLKIEFRGSLVLSQEKVALLKKSPFAGSTQEKFTKYDVMKSNHHESRLYKVEWKKQSSFA